MSKAAIRIAGMRTGIADMGTVCMGIITATAFLSEAIRTSITMTGIMTTITATIAGGAADTIVGFVRIIDRVDHPVATA